MLYLLFSLVSGVAQSASPSTLLADLPDGSRLQVTRALEMGLIEDSQHLQMLHYCTSENGVCTPDYEIGFIGALGSSYNTQLNLRTDVETALSKKGGGVFSDGTYYLNAGVYCLDRSESEFRSGTDDRSDKLRLTDCAGNSVFTIYARAGYRLRNRVGFRGFTVEDFHFQAGTALRWLQ